ncbi:hypothetical protein HDV00_004771 [Rhizophlyctis rosea]|nr:hypothetical protein HDV00_004771 [Rhizophlyctis rosea]
MYRYRPTDRVLLEPEPRIPFVILDAQLPNIPDMVQLSHIDCDNFGFRQAVARSLNIHMSHLTIHLPQPIDSISRASLSPPLSIADDLPSDISMENPLVVHVHAVRMGGAHTHSSMEFPRKTETGAEGMEDWPEGNAKAMDQALPTFAQDITQTINTLRKGLPDTLMDLISMYDCEVSHTDEPDWRHAATLSPTQIVTYYRGSHAKWRRGDQILIRMRGGKNNTNSTTYYQVTGTIAYIQTLNNYILIETPSNEFPAPEISYPEPFETVTFASYIRTCINNQWEVRSGKVTWRDRGRMNLTNVWEEGLNGAGVFTGGGRILGVVVGASRKSPEGCCQVVDFFELEEMLRNRWVDDGRSDE